MMMCAVIVKLDEWDTLRGLDGGGHFKLDHINLLYTKSSVYRDIKYSINVGFSKKKYAYIKL